MPNVKTLRRYSAAAAEFYVGNCMARSAGYQYPPAIQEVQRGIPVKAERIAGTGTIPARFRPP